MRLEDRVAIVTGSASGIGRAVAERFLAEGARVVLCDIDAEALEEARGVLRNDAVLLCPCDVTKPDEVERMVGAAIESWEKVDILVNNAGIIRPAMLEKMTEAEWDEVVRVHLRASFLCTRAVARRFIDRSRKEALPCAGKIVNITSVAGLRGTVGQVNYAAAKAGLIGLTLASARELGRYRVNVNSVAFGVVETRMTEKIRADEKFRNFYLEQIVLGRFARPEEAAHPVLFLASSEADYITGQVLVVDGGLHIAV